MKLPVPAGETKGHRRPASQEGDSEDLRITADFQLGPTTAEWRRLMGRLMSPVLDEADQDFEGTTQDEDCNGMLNGDRPVQEGWDIPTENLLKGGQP